MKFKQSGCEGKERQAINLKKNKEEEEAEEAAAEEALVCTHTRSLLKED